MLVVIRDSGKIVLKEDGSLLCDNLVQSVYNAVLSWPNSPLPWVPFIWPIFPIIYPTIYQYTTSLSFIRVTHPTIYPNINFSTWWQGFCASLWSVGGQRAARLEKIMALFEAKLSGRNSHHLFAPEISLIWGVGRARKLILDNLTSWTGCGYVMGRPGFLQRCFRRGRSLIIQEIFNFRKFISLGSRLLLRESVWANLD